MDLPRQTWLTELKLCWHQGPMSAFALTLCPTAQRLFPSEKYWASPSGSLTFCPGYQLALSLSEREV